MSPLNYLNGATGDPALVSYRVAPQPTQSIPADEAAFSDFYGFGGPFTISPGVIQPQALRGASISPLATLIGKLALKDVGFRLGDADPVNKMLLNGLANLCTRYTHTNNTTWHRWLFSPGAATLAAPFLTMLEDNNVLPIARYTDCAIKSYALAAAPGANLSVAFNIVRGMFDLHGLVTQTAGSGSTLPIFRKFWTGQMTADAVDKDLFLKIVSVAGKTARGKVSAAAAYGAIDDAWLYDVWNRLYNEQTDEIDRRVGTFAEQVEWFLATGATLTDADIFKVEKLRDKWSPSLPTRRAFSSVETAFILDGSERRIEGGYTLTLERQNVTRREDTGGRQSASVQVFGVLTPTLQFSRQLQDLDVQAALLAGTPLPVVLRAESADEIGSSGKAHKLITLLPAMRPQGDTFGVNEGATGRDESVTMVGAAPDTTFSYAGESTDEAVAIIVDTSVSAL